MILPLLMHKFGQLYVNISPTIHLNNTITLDVFPHFFQNRSTTEQDTDFNL